MIPKGYMKESPNKRFNLAKVLPHRKRPVDNRRKVRTCTPLRSSHLWFDALGLGKGKSIWDSA